MGASPIHWVSFLGYHFNLIGWKVWTGKCSLVKGVSKQPLLLLSSMLWEEKQATPRFLPAAWLFGMLRNHLQAINRKNDSWPDRFWPKLQVFIVKSAIFVCKIWIAQKIFNFLVPWYALHEPIMKNKENRRFKKQGKDPSCKGLPSYNRGKGKGREGSLPFHIDSNWVTW